MIIGVDIGGTKTLIARFNVKGEIEKEREFKTPQQYEDFITALTHHAENFVDQPLNLVCAGVPGLLDRRRGIVHSLGNLPWQEKPIAKDISLAFKKTHTIIENDAKLAGLSEIRQFKGPHPKRALYLTISTGIGGALLINGRLTPEMIDMELGKAPLEFEGKIQHWEDFASGRAFAQAYGKLGDDEKDPKVWHDYATKRLGPGVAVACSYLQVDTIIFGGGLGHHSHYFIPALQEYLENKLASIVVRPKQMKSAKHGKNAVVYGCYEHAKDHLAFN